MELGLPFIIAILVGLTTLLVFLVKSFGPKKDTHQEEDEEIVEEKPAPESKSAGDAPKKKKTEVKRSVKSAYSHPWLLSSLKGHTADITAMDFDSSGKHLATCAEDRFVIIWSTKDFDKKEHKHTRGKVDFDHGLYVKWSPDSKAIVVYKASANCVEVYKLTKKPDGKLGELEVAITFPEKHKQDVLGLGIDINGKYIMTCSTDNSLVIWTLKGEVLEEVNLNLATTYSAVLSPCGRFVIASGFTPDVKVFEVAFSKAGVFEKVQRAFELKGHTSGVYSVAANTASTRMATVSKDNSWKMFDTDIDYHKGQEPYLLFSVPFECAGGKPVISLSPDGLSVAVACGPHISFFSGITGKFIRKLEHVHEGNVKSLMFDPSNKYLLSCGDKHVRIFHNVVGYMAVIEDLEQKKKTAAHSAMKDRIVQQIADAKKFLKSLGES